MCGIVGCVRKGWPLDHAASLRMRDSLVHRGPDDAGLWSSPTDGVMLGSRRLAILDLSPRGHQPMRDHTGNLTIAFNGEIYNWLGLRDELKSYPFRSRTDTEVLLAAYARWGTECLAFLNGMFAFAIWDASQKQLFAARDRFGEKPFYYFRRRGTFLFASEMKALFASGLVPAEPTSAPFTVILPTERPMRPPKLFSAMSPHWNPRTRFSILPAAIRLNRGSTGILIPTPGFDIPMKLPTPNISCIC